MRRDPSTINAYKTKSADDEWLTPPDIVKAIEVAFGGEIACDPCASDGDSHVCARTRYTIIDRGETKDWPDATFCNPPFSNAAPFVKQAISIAKRSSNRIYMLLPVRPDASHQRDALDAAADALFLGERVIFHKNHLGKLVPSQQGGKVSVMILGFNYSTSHLVKLGLIGTVMKRVESHEDALRMRHRIDSYAEELPPEDDQPLFPSEDDEAAFLRLAQDDEERRQKELADGRYEVQRSRLPPLPKVVAAGGTVVGSLRKLQAGIKELSAFLQPRLGGSAMTNGASLALVGQRGTVRLAAVSDSAVAIIDVADMASSSEIRTMLPSAMLSRILAAKIQRPANVRIDLQDATISVTAETLSETTEILSDFPLEVDELLNRRDRRLDYQWEWEADRCELEKEIRALNGVSEFWLFECDGKAHASAEQGVVRVKAAVLLQALTSLKESGIVITRYVQPPVLRIAGSAVSERFIYLLG